MAVKGLSDRVADLAIERVAALLADRVADRVVAALMKAGFDQQPAHLETRQRTPHSSKACRTDSQNSGPALSSVSKA